MIPRTIAARIRQLHDDSAGHVAGLIGLIPAAGAALLGAGAASGEDALTIIGAIALAVGLSASGVVQHMTIDYPIYERLNALESDEPSEN